MSALRPVVRRPACPGLGMLLAAAVLLAGCAGRGGTAWNGRRGYDGNGDYGYDLAASRSEARAYRAGAAGFYPAPGPASDPWGPYVREAASRHQVPEQWIRAVMRQESGGRQYAADGSLITSVAGAMGLMQVMPRTYDMLRVRYGLGDDPFNPRDNILAGTAYIREMYDRYGAPGFLAAYNAGPERLEGYLSGAAGLPDETINYLARIAPNLGTEVAMTGPLSVFAGTGQAFAANTVLPAPMRPRQGGPDSADLAYAGGGLVGSVAPAAYEPDAPADASLDPADRAFDGGGLVTASAPTGVLTVRPAPAPAPAPAAMAVAASAAPVSWSRLGSAAVAPAPKVAPPSAVPPIHTPPTPTARMAAVAVAPALTPTLAPGTPSAGWGIQVGAFADPAISRAAIANARARAGDLLAEARPAITTVQRDTLLYRARFTGLSGSGAGQACATLLRGGVACLTVPPGS